MTVLCDCCRWEAITAAASEPIWITTSLADASSSTLPDELSRRIAERLRRDGRMAVVGDDASVAMVDAANIELAPVLGDTAGETIRHGAASGVAIGFDFAPDGDVSSQLEALHARGALTVLVTPHIGEHHRSTVDFCIVVDQPDSETTAGAVAGFWRHLVGELTAVSPG